MYKGIDAIDVDKMHKALAELSRIQEWKKWSEKIPAIHWPSHWAVKSIPAFGGAIVRYIVSKPSTNVSVSIYLDCYNALGYYSGPYWEIYPHQEDVYRCGMDNVDELLEAITEAFLEQEKINEQKK